MNNQLKNKDMPIIFGISVFASIVYGVALVDDSMQILRGRKKEIDLRKALIGAAVIAILWTFYYFFLTRGIDA